MTSSSGWGDDRRTARSAAQRRVRVLVLPGCPHRDLVVARVSLALLDAGQAAAVDIVVVDSPEDAMGLGFRGSPTLLVDGHDPFPAPDSSVWACRLYRTERGLEGAPSVTQLLEALTGH